MALSEVKSSIFVILVIYRSLVDAAVSPELGACTSNPCLNSGLCTSSLNGYVCTCVNGYIGVRCERRSDECKFSDSLRCVNGHCKIDPSGTPRCECNANFGGRNCNTKLNTCEYASCNKGLCVNTENGYQCKCPAGFVGKNCQINSVNIATCLGSCKKISVGTNGGKCWHNGSEVIKVGWGYEHSLCNTKENCFDMPSSNVDYIDVQIKPVQAQPNDSLVFLTDIDAALYNNMFIPHVIPVEAISSDAFTHCNTSLAIPIANLSAIRGGEMLVNTTYLKIGTQYFIANVNTLHRCEFGLRLNVTIKDNKCIDTSNPARELCHGHGRCYTDFTKKSFECSCCGGYLGKYCEAEDPCFLNPCKNNGQCNVITDSNGVNTFRCKCPHGFRGFDCNQTIDHCESSPCHNGAACHSSASGFSCKCKTGFSGSTCAINEDQCASNPCRNGGSCSDGDNSFTCTCLSGFKGSLCEVNIDDCSANPCHNGTCIDGINKYHCHCRPGFTGQACDVAPDQCNSSPCIHGKCLNKGNSYECSCGIGYTGHLCEIKINLCQNTLFCLEDNSLACIDHGNNVTCNCVKGYSGINCGVNTDDCAGNPCKNGGTCVDKLDGFECKCTGGASGATCEVMATTTKKPQSTGIPVDTKKSTPPATDVITGKPNLQVTVDLQILTDKCSRLQEPQALKNLGKTVLSIIRDSCNCEPSNGEILPQSSLVRCSDEMSGKFVTKMSFKDSKEQKLILCSLNTRIRKGHVPTADHNTYIVGINTNTAICDENVSTKGPIPAGDSPRSDSKTGIIIGSIVAVIILIVFVIFLSLRFRNRAVREVKDTDPDNVKSFLNFVYQSDVELTSPRSAWNSPVVEHDSNRLQYAIKKPKFKDTSFSLDNPGGMTSTV